MDFQYLLDLQLVLGVDHPCALLQPIRPDLMVHPSYCARLSFHPKTLLGKPGKDARCRNIDILCIRFYHKYAPDITRFVLTKGSRMTRNKEQRE